MRNPYGNSRRLFLRGGLLGGAAGLVAQAQTTGAGGTTAGDQAIMRFIALNEMIAADLTSQLAGQVRFNPGLGTVLSGLDPLLQSILLQIAADEQSHAQFMAGFLPVVGVTGLDVAPFATLPNWGGPLATFTATGAAGSAGTGSGSSSGVTNPETGLPDAPGDNFIVLGGGTVTGGSLGTFGMGTTGRLTSLTQVRLNTTFFSQVRSALSSEFGANFTPFLQSQAPVSAIPTSGGANQSGLSAGSPGASTDATNRQATALSMLLLLAQMEIAEATLYASFAPKLTSADAVSVAASLSPIEAMHYAAIQTALARIAAGTAASMAPTGGTGSGTGTTGGTGGGTGATGGTGTTGGTSGGTGTTGTTGTGGGSGTTGTGTGTTTATNPFGPGSVFPGSIPGVNALAQNATQAQQIFPVPFRFLQQLPLVAALRAHGLQSAAQAHARMIVDSGLLTGQSQAFLTLLMDAATAADQAVRACR